jgi:hypothetical protein
VALLTVAGGIIGFLHRFEKNRYQDKVSSQQERFELELERTKARLEAEKEQLRQSHKEEVEEIEKEKNEEIADAQKKLEAHYRAIKEEVDSQGAVEDSMPLLQEEKVVYVKYLYIRSEEAGPAYTKYVERIGKHIDVYSEYYYVRFNKLSKTGNSITVRDRSSGVVDLTLIYPWKRLTFADEGSASISQVIAQDLEGRDTYFTASTYYNGFSEGNEDIGMKMEMDTTVARMIADFSSVVGFSSLFVSKPEAYRVDTDQRRTKLLGLEQIKPGVYHIEAQNLKKGEVVMLDFHVDWEKWASSSQEA